jgi:hypothetical protein
VQTAEIMPPAMESKPAVTNALAVGSSAPPTVGSPTIIDEIIPAGCSSCGGGVNGLIGGSGGCSTCGGGEGRCDANCGNPGQRQCDCCCTGKTFVGRFACELYQCLCCPDPCYSPPHWLAVADAGFFVDAARPITVMRLRWDSAFDFQNPDRAEWFWAKQRTNPVAQVATAKGTANVAGKGPGLIAHKLDYEELRVYNEGATGAVGAFVETAYREVTATPGAASGSQTVLQDSNFADMTAGAKTLMLDCELLQLTFQFKTYIPVGNFLKGFGTGHASLEPSFLYNVKIGPNTYLQGQTAYWIPVGGDQIWDANILHNHFSLNQVLWHPCGDLQLIGTAELNEWTIFGGQYTVDAFGMEGKNGTVFGQSAGGYIISAGPGLRWVLCDKYDLGVGSAFSLTGTAWAHQTIRAEFRMRF